MPVGHRTEVRGDGGDQMRGQREERAEVLNHAGDAEVRVIDDNVRADAAAAVMRVRVSAGVTSVRAGCRGRRGR